MDGTVEVRRSTRRRRTVSAFREGDRTIVLLPARMSQAEEEQWVATMVARLAAREARRTPSDAVLLARAVALSNRWLDGAAVPASVAWSPLQRRRWGSCSPNDRAIRVSSRLAGMPPWVVDYVLFHELTHLVVFDHSAEFWALVDRYPQAERARGFLLGLAYAEQLRPASDDPDGGAEGGAVVASPGVAEPGTDADPAQLW